MRSRPWITWLIFAVGALLVLEGLGWVTWQALRFESRERLARAEARQQEAIRLALWRMESELAPILAQESARPYFHYRSFYPAGAAYESMWLSDAAANQMPLIASPLLESAGLYTRLHFQLEPDGRLTSPQAPVGPMRDLALAPSSQGGVGLSPEELMLADERLQSLQRTLSTSTTLTGNLDASRFAGATPHDQDAMAPSPPAAPPSPKPNAPPTQTSSLELSKSEYAVRQQMAQNVREYGEAQNAAPGLRSAARRATSPPAVSRIEDAGAKHEPPLEALARANAPELGRETRDERADLASPSEAKAKSIERAPESLRAEVALGEHESPATIELGPIESRWLKPQRDGAPELVLFRSLRLAPTHSSEPPRAIVQGAWLDWPELAKRLERLCWGLLPGASVSPALGVVPPEQQGRLLATFPVLLEPGPAPTPDPVGLTATRLTLGATWLAVLGAIGAIGWVLHSSMDLSGRRGRFVSAVTHELRTPLTSFCLYTEMLDRGLVQGEVERARYLSTLRAESTRLTRLVENVLSYSRLSESGAGSPPVVGVMDLAGAIERMRPVLEQRAGASEMTLVFEGFSPGRTALGDEGTLERILFNLVDNACKYAGGDGTPSDRRRIVVRLVPEGASARGRVHIDVRDFGPGVAWADRRRIFRPFYRLKRDAEDPASGLGLGLGLARGLARQMRGDLVVLNEPGPGAAFRVTLRAGA